jgi:hypothetical protein
MKNDVAPRARNDPVPWTPAIVVAYAAGVSL